MKALREASPLIAPSESLRKVLITEGVVLGFPLIRYKTHEVFFINFLLLSNLANAENTVVAVGEASFEKHVISIDADPDL